MPFCMLSTRSGVGQLGAGRRHDHAVRGDRAGEEIGEAPRHVQGAGPAHAEARDVDAVRVDLVPELGDLDQGQQESLAVDGVPRVVDEADPLRVHAHALRERPRARGLARTAGIHAPAVQPEDQAALLAAAAVLDPLGRSVGRLDLRLPEPGGGLARRLPEQVADGLQAPLGERTERRRLVEEARADGRIPGTRSASRDGPRTNASRAPGSPSCRSSRPPPRPGAGPGGRRGRAGRRGRFGRGRGATWPEYRSRDRGGPRAGTRATGQGGHRSNRRV